MKKYLGISILLIVISIVGLTTIVVFDSRQYFKEYFTDKRNKLNLRSEKSVDSLLTVIIVNNKTIDSLNIMIKSEKDKSKYNDSLNRKTIINLQNAINHQNQIINLQQLKIGR